MNDLPPPQPIAEIELPDAQSVAELRKKAQPAVLRGLIRDWPAVEAANRGDRALIDYLSNMATGRQVSAIAADPAQGGRFFYNAELTGLNFVKARGWLRQFLSDLLAVCDDPTPPAMAVQSEPIPEVLPDFAHANRLDLLPGVMPRIWIGNSIRVAPHYDVKENVACCVAGRRRFTLFPPDQIANLYPGPFELTPAGTPVSMVDQAQPDLVRYPRYEEAWTNALQATLMPGDAIYIPYCWWHGVESLDPVSMLVNYWWHDATPGSAGPYDALLHAMLAYRHMPENERQVWRTMLDHYVFQENGDPAAHLPAHAKGIFGPPSPELFEQMRGMLRRSLG